MRPVAMNAQQCYTGREKVCTTKFTGVGTVGQCAQRKGGFNALSHRARDVDLWIVE